MTSVDLKIRVYNGVKEFVASPKMRGAAIAITLAALGALAYSSQAVQECLNPIPNCPETGMISLRKENCFDFIAGLFGSTCNIEVLGPCLPCITPETICTQAAPHVKTTFLATAAIVIGLGIGLFFATDKKPSSSNSEPAKPSVNGTRALPNSASASSVTASVPTPSAHKPSVASASALATTTPMPQSAMVAAGVRPQALPKPASAPAVMSTLPAAQTATASVRPSDPANISLTTSKVSSPQTPSGKLHPVSPQLANLLLNPTMLPGAPPATLPHKSQTVLVAPLIQTHPDKLQPPKPVGGLTIPTALSSPPKKLTGTIPPSMPLLKSASGPSSSKSASGSDEKEMKEAGPGMSVGASNVESPSPMIVFSATVPPRPPKLREATPEEARVEHNDPLRTRPAPLPNRGNTCFAASLAQAWLFDHENAIKAKAELLEKREKDASAAKQLLSFIEECRKASRENRAVNIMPLMEALRNIHPIFAQDYLDYLERSKRQFLDSIEGDAGYLFLYENQKNELDSEILAIKACPDDPDLQSKLPSKETELARVNKIVSYLGGLKENKEIGSLQLQQDLEELGALDLLIPPPQQDAQEMIQCLYGFIYEDESRTTKNSDVINLQSFGSLRLADGESLTGDSDPKLQALGQGGRYIGSTFLTPDYEFRIVEGADKIKRKGCYIKEGSSSLPELFKKAFFDVNIEPVRRQVSTKEGVKEKEVEISSTRTYLSQAPNQFVLSVKRSITVLEKVPNSDKSRWATYALRGSLEDLNEIMEVPGDYFLDGDGSTYRLDGVIVHKGGASANGGHYMAVSRRFNQNTGESALYDCDDQRINIRDTAHFLKQAGDAYVLVFNKIS